MDEDRGYLSVVVPVHPAFAAEKTGFDGYAESIVAALAPAPLTLTELAHALGYIRASPSACAIP